MNYPTKDDIVQIFVERYVNRPRDYDLDDAIYEIISEWDEQFKDDENWYFMDEQLGETDIKDELREEVLEYFNYTYPVLIKRSFTDV